MKLFNIIGYLVSAPVIAGWDYAYFQRKFPLIAEGNWKEDRISAFMPGYGYGLVIWYAALPVEYFLFSEHARYGWSLKNGPLGPREAK